MQTKDSKPGIYVQKLHHFSVHRADGSQAFSSHIPASGVEHFKKHVAKKAGAAAVFRGTVDKEHEINHSHEASILKGRMRAHKRDVDAGGHPNSETHYDNAKSAHDAHTHAHEVNNSNASDKEKRQATHKAMEAHFKYWKNDPRSSVEHGSERNERKFDKHVNNAENIAS